jgi:putative sigma-54 modulation protein
MQINLQGRNIELTDAIKNYVSKRITGLEKLFSGVQSKKGDARADFELVKTTNHHKAGEIFHASCKISVGGKVFYGESDNEDLQAAIDQVKENLFMEITKSKDRGQTLMKRGASSIKKMLKGMTKRNPFTSKY